MHHPQEAEQFYRALGGRQIGAGMEATGSFRWFRRLLSELGRELWLGNSTQIRASPPRRQKTDQQDARQLLKLLLSEAIVVDLAIAVSPELTTGWRELAMCRVVPEMPGI